MNHSTIDKLFQDSANKEKAKILAGFFKTGKGEYGQGDVFLGITVPVSRKIAKQLENISYEEIEELLQSNIHEKRLVALLILVHNYEFANRNKDEAKKQQVFDYYLKNTKRINNWDLVDLTAPKIVGNFLLDKNRKILSQLALSDSLWEKRIAIISTFEFIRNNQYSDTLEISKVLINDKHDLIHKAVGWMLREIGKRNQNIEEEFLREIVSNKARYKLMPRTMLRYAIERFDEEKRKKYLNGTF